MLPLLSRFPQYGQTDVYLGILLTSFTLNWFDYSSYFVVEAAKRLLEEGSHDCNSF